MRTQVGIIGAGPAGLMLSHLLHLRGIESVVIDLRTRDDIEQTIKAGVLEQNTVDLLADTGVGERVKREGAVHEGIDIRFGGRGHRLDLADLTDGRTITVYPQHEVLKDLIAKRLGDGGDVRFGVSAVAVSDVESTRPQVRFTDADGREQTLDCDFVAGCDGSQTSSRFLIPAGSVRRDHFRQYPFAWIGILARAPRTAEELIYAHHRNGFALISTRSAAVQRMYFQCDPTDTVEEWSDDRIWAELSTRVNGDGAEIRPGEIFQKAVMHLRSFVCEPMQHGRLFLAGDSAHVVPPTGAKGLNLAMADVHVLARALGGFYADGSEELLASYTDVALERVWRAQHFSWWFTSLLHRHGDDFDLLRQVAELKAVVGSRAGSTYLAENYVGFPLD